MAKPILLVGVPSAQAENIADIQESIEEGMKDYYLLIYDYTGRDIKFQCFYEKDFNEVKYEELKFIIKHNLTK